jgi:hypothetical protein
MLCVSETQPSSQTPAPLHAQELEPPADKQKQLGGLNPQPRSIVSPPKKRNLRIDSPSPRCARLICVQCTRLDAPTVAGHVAATRGKSLPSTAFEGP